LLYKTILGTEKQIYGRMLKANLSWSPTQAKFFQLISSLYVVVFQLNLTKHKTQT